MAKQGINRFANFLSDEYKAGRKFPGFKSVAPSMGNAYIGLKPTKGLVAGVAVGAMIYAAASTGLSATDRSETYKARGEDVGNLGALSYDAVGNVSGGKRDLGATGDLVFGLHNMRRGG